jgi:hypothetical protein
MATVAATHVWVARGVLKTTWAGLGDGDVGDGLSAPHLPDKTIQVIGTFGSGGSVTAQGSNDSGTTYHDLNDSRGEGNAATFTAADIRMLVENPELVRPNVTAGDQDTDLTVIIISQSGRR